MHRCRNKHLRNHQGQASIFVLALMGVVLVATIFLYQSGRVTSEKMQLQNAADAAAFGASTLEARSLNFSAYTNRAMVANEVAIGQMVGILSMVDEVKSLGEYLQAYGFAIELATSWLFLVVTVGDAIELIISGLVTILEEVGESIEAVGEAIAKVLDVIATPIVTGLSINNEVYSVSQQLYHGATMVLVTTNMFKSLEDNTYGTHFSLTDLVKRNRSGAQVSDLGLISLAMHMPSYWSGYTERYSTGTTSTKKDKDNKKKEKDATDKQKKEDKKKEAQTKKDDLKKEEQQKKDDLKEEEQQKKDDMKEEEQLEKDDKAVEDKLKGKDKEAKEKEDRDKEASKKLVDKTKENKKKAEDQQKENEQKLEDEKKENKEKLDDQKKEATKTKKKKKSKKQTKNDAGMGRLAATVRNARDPFSSGGDPIRVKNFLGMEVDYKNRDWFLGLELILNPKGKFDLKLIKAEYELNLGLSVGIRSKGGSEIRYKDETYIWSGLDTLLGGPGFKWGYDISLTEGIGKFSTHQHYKGQHEVELGLPLGGGVSQAIKSAAEDVGGGALTPVDFVDSPGLFTLEPYAYGEAGKGERMIMVEAASPDLEDNQVSGYSGLKAYRDRPADKAKEDPKKPPVIPFQSPFFLVGLTRQMSDITDKGPQFSGKLDLNHDDNNTLINHIGVIAKSQVYFSRPQDLRYFLRDDKKKEKSNVFSPFWQARLVDTTNLDRLLALAMQDHVVWLSGNIQDDVPGLKKVIQFLQDVFGVFR
jgi:hypothetical protein